jgi:tetrahedral aminopeptidase
METVQLLRELTQASGVAGYEDEVRALVQRACEPLATSLRSDSLGNLVAFKQGTAEAPRRSIMLAAHMDEIGLIVTGFEGAFMRFGRVGGVDLRTIVGQEVVVHGARPLPGIVASHPPHVTPPEKRNEAIPLVDMFLDVGLPAERVRELVHVGDVVTLRRDLIELQEGYVSGKAFDDRAGVVALVRCLELLGHMQHTWDVYAVATTQEEVGLRGATVSAYGIAPDIGVCVDVGFGMQQGVSESEAISMDGGPALGRGPNIHPLMFKRLKGVAEANELPHQVEVLASGSGTDAWAIQVAREGVPTALLSLPLRYMHTTVETICLRDIERTGRLLALFISGLDAAFAQELGLTGGIKCC